MSYHIKSDGLPGICKAKPGNCPLGGQNDHYENKEEALKAGQERLERIYGYSGDPIEMDYNEYQELAMTLSKSELDENISKINESLEEAKGLKKIRLKKKIAISEAAKEGINHIAKSKQAEEERIAKMKAHDELMTKNAKAIKDVRYIDLPSNVNYETKQFRRYNINAYRGEMEDRDDNEVNTGVGMFGRGIYTTPDRKQAKQYGKVREVSPEEMPAVPLRFKTTQDYNQFEYELAKQFNTEKNELYKHNSVEEIILKTGHDGMTLGTGKDMIVVQFDTPTNRERYPDLFK